MQLDNNPWIEQAADIGSLSFLSYMAAWTSRHQKMRIRHACLEPVQGKEEISL
jgi:hypothetical protein